MELERVKYVLKSYLRTRIMKIERFLFFMVEKDQAHLLSPAEMDYAWTLYEAKKDHLKNEFFQNVPNRLNCMKEDAEIPDLMITKPNPKQFVFMRFLMNFEIIRFENEIDLKGVQEDQIFFFPFDQIKTFLEKGQAELI
mmetsp:Transcript_17932/g.30504  ORF Transcript_17932/g.30504 Transcript_17932/m.30504 type:complete len:139 (-) Transcript_17932:45-461(-)